MSSAYAKAKLKASREALAAKQWDAALAAADEVLGAEAGHYNALVFRALALLHLERRAESEAAYRLAIAAQPDTLLAWQGLEKLYAQTRAWQQLAECQRRQMDLLRESGDATRLAETLQRLVELQKAEGDSVQLACALELYLSSSPYYPLLSSLPEPDQSAPAATTTFEAQLAVHVRSLDVLQEVLHLYEKAEEATVAREVEKRRTRLDVARKTREELRRNVESDVLGESKLPALYEQVLSHASASDVVRREAESKLLHHRHRLLLATPGTAPRHAGAAASAASDEADAEAMARKLHARDELVSLAKGMVTIDVPEELAWEVVLEWTDYVALTDLPRERLRAFISRFPHSGRSLAFRALLHLLQDEQFLLEEAEETQRRDVEQAAPDLLALAIRALEEAPHSLLAHRIAATFYLLDGDYLSVSDVATSALSLLRRIESDAAVSLGNSRRDIETQLASALTRLHPPQHHVRALRLVSSVLGAAPDNIDALLSKGLIDEAAGRWEEARAAFVHVQQLALAQAAASPLSPSRAPALEAQGEVAWCDVCAGRLEEGRVALEAVIDRLDDAASAAVVDGAARARAWWRLGRCLWQIGGEARSDPDQAFTCFITALKRSAGFAPAFTALGFFYDEVAKDAARASKCFQKAFELDAREDEAARRLAEGFAEEREWDLVDVVARRTVEGEGGAEALGGAAGNVSQKRHMSRNAWAWRAIGSVELHRERHEEAIAAFQVALRAEPHDAGTWQRLGEAYAASQRQAAALKTFAKALQLSHGAWQVRYSIAEVHRELGDVDEAQELLEHILKEQPEEIGVRVAAAETSLQLAQREVQTGYVLRAEASLETTLQHVLQAVRLEPHLRSAWKVAADALFELSRFGRLVQGRTMREGVVEQLVQLAAQDDVDAQLGDVSSAVTLKYVAQCRESEHAYLSAAAFLYKACVVLHGSDEDATAWADLAVALHQLDLVAKLKDAATQGTQCIQRALKLEPGNEALWMILGSLAFKTNVKLAQHCFVRAIEASPRDAVPWSHLGFLYLQHDDAELANEAFIRAQTLDPDLATAWVGQAFVAQHHDDEQAARVLFEHAVGLSEGSALEADYGFAACVFAQFSSASPPPPIHLHSPASALSSFVAFRPSDTSALHLSALFCERLGEQALAIERIERASALLEREYEEDEDVVTATKYAIAQSNLGRIRLDAGDAAGAIEALETALGLLDLGEGDAASEAVLPAANRARVRTAAHLGVALAHFARGAADASLDAFRAALADVEGSTADADGELRAQVGVQMARVLWSLGGDERQEEAKAQLLDCIAAAPQHIPAITALAALGVLTHDTGLVDAALSEVRELSPAQLQRLDGERDVDFLLSMVQFGDNDAAGALATLEAATKTQPPSIQAHLSLVEARLRVAASSSSAEEAQAALAAAQLAFGTVNSSDAGEAHYAHAMRLLALATALSGAAKPQKAPPQDSEAANGDEMLLPPTMPPDMAQRALHAAPWVKSNWLAAALERT